MRLFRFKNFLNESAPAGRGSGVNFVGACAVNIMYEVSATNLRVREINAIPDKFSASGSKEVITGVSPWLLTADTDELNSIKPDKLRQIKVKNICKQLCKKFDIEEGMYGNLGEFMKANPDLTVSVKVSAKFNYADNHFAGYTRGKFSNGDPVMQTVTGVASYSDVFVQGISADDNEELIKSFAPRLKATKRFIDFYNQAFNDEGKHEFVRDEIQAKVESSGLEQELQSFIEEIAGYSDYTVDQLKQHIQDNAGTLEDFTVYMEDKEQNSEIESDWKKSIEAEYTASYDPSSN
jgi:hypothetical protein